MTLSYPPIYGLFGSIALLLGGFMCLAYNKSIADAWVNTINEFVNTLLPKAGKVIHKRKFFYHFVRVFCIIVGILVLIEAFIILRKFISAI